MKHPIHFLLLPLVGLATLAAAPPAQAQQPGADTVEVTINAIPGLKFDRVRFQVRPGAPVRLVFNNQDSEGDMDHNWVLTRPGARMEVVQASMNTTADQEYVARVPEVLVFTPLVKKGNSYVLRFTAPTEPGAYPYVCTFPGHGFVMYGVMYVGQPMPPLAQDENVPPGQRAAADAAPVTAARPYPGLSYGTDGLPAVSRTFIEGSGPAAIAVGLPGGQSYNFDAGEAFLRSAWSGGFVDNQRHWRGNGNAYADVQGEVYYQSRVGFPLRIGSRDSAAVEFRGYRLVDGGYPEFHYSVDGAEVYELIRPAEGGRGLVRTFRIESREPVRVRTDGEEGVRFEASAGRWTGGVLELTPAQARSFTLSLTPATEGAR